ncbi:MAG: PCMD domain-containing protein [Bacteroidales bacterium]
MKIKGIENFKFVFFLLFAFILTLTGACTDLNSLKDDAIVKSVTISSHAPSSIILGTPDVNLEKRIITIPVLYGKYQFPLSMKLNLNTSNGDTKGIDFNNDVVFQNISERKKFFVIAESGLASAWYIELKEIPLAEGNYIESFDIISYEPAKSVISLKPEINAIEGKVKILAANVTFPLQLNANIRFSDLAKVEGYDVKDPKPIELKSAEDKYVISVTSASGNKKDWEISVTQCVELSPDAPRVELNGVDFDQVTLSIAGDKVNQYVLERTWNVRTGELDVYVRDSVDNSSIFPTSVDFKDLIVSSNSELLGCPADHILSFQDASTVRTFYVIDRINSTMRTWNVKVAKALNPSAYIEAIAGKKEGTFPIGISVEGFTIYPLEKKVIMTVSNVFTTSMKVTITDLQVSKGAEVIDQPSVLTFANSDGVNTIKVKAEDGTIVNWLIIAKSKNAYKSDRAEVTSFDIRQYESKTNKMLLSQIVYIDQLKKSVVLTVEEGAWDFPLKVKGVMHTSPFSLILPLDGQSSFDPNTWITFNDANSVIPFDVKAEDGTVVRWNMMLKSSGNLNNQAELLGITFVDEPTNVVLSSEYFIDTQNDIIYFQVSDGVDNFPLVIKPVFELSKGAMTDLPNKFPMTFENLKSVNTVIVTSEDGSVKKDWKIKLIYTPQLENSDFEKWISNTELVPGANQWTSANNTFVKGTSRSEDAVNSYYSVQMVTSKVDNPLAREIAAGSLFLGQFKFNISDKGNPRQMTWFGTPFTTRPSELLIDVNYVRGANLEQSINNGFIPVTGEVDSASVIVEALRWTGPANQPFEYHGIPTPNVEVLGAGKYIFTTTNGWENVGIPIKYTPSINSVTHFSVSIASSAKGDQFIGAKDSRLLVDNVRLIYPETPTGSNIEVKYR